MIRTVLAAVGALFSLWRPVANNVDFGLHFGVILGAQSSTILTVGSLRGCLLLHRGWIWLTCSIYAVSAGLAGHPRLREQGQVVVTGRFWGPKPSVHRLRLQDSRLDILQSVGCKTAKNCQLQDCQHTPLSLVAHKGPADFNVFFVVVF